jgi:hypothetical protein
LAPTASTRLTTALICASVAPSFITIIMGVLSKPGRCPVGGCGEREGRASGGGVSWRGNGCPCSQEPNA